MSKPKPGHWLDYLIIEWSRVSEYNDVSITQKLEK